MKNLIRVDSFRSRCRCCEKGTVNSFSLSLCVCTRLSFSRSLVKWTFTFAFVWSVWLFQCHFAHALLFHCKKKKHFVIEKWRKKERENKSRPHESNDDTKIKHDSNRWACALVLNSYRTSEKRAFRVFQLQQKKVSFK